jgi:CheY-like chemotaxis protein
LKAAADEVPADFAIGFGALLDGWSEACRTDEPFEWSAVVERSLLQRAATYWTALARASRTAGTALEAPPEEVKPFFDALVAGIAEALREDHAVRPTLLSVIPDFDERLAARPGAGAGGKTRVLIVDDTEDIRLLLRIGLGHEPAIEICGEAVDGLDAIEQAECLRPDAILLDLAMPRMTGHEALPRLRETLPDARIVIFSADVHARQSLLDAGAHAFLAKGGNPRDVAAALLGSAGPG